MRNLLHRITFGLVLSTDQANWLNDYEQGRVRMTYKGVMAVNQIKGGVHAESQR